MTWGLLYLLSVFTNVVLSNKKTQKKILDYITYEDEKEEEEKPKKEVKAKPTTKRVVKDRTIKKIKRK